MISIEHTELGHWSAYSFLIAQGDSDIRCFQVKETIMTSALLQLPLSMSKREKQQRVVAIIEQLVSFIRSRTCFRSETCSRLQAAQGTEPTRHHPAFAKDRVSPCLESC